MNSPSYIARRAGLTALLISSGECLSSNGKRFKALVNREVKSIRDGVIGGQGRIDFGVMGLTEIELLIGAAPTPADGVTYSDAYGISHRVIAVFKTDLTWVLYAQPA